MKKLFKTSHFISAIVIATLLLPTMAFGAGLIPCGDDLNGDGMIKDMQVLGVVYLKEECNFDDVILLINAVIKFLIYNVAVPVSALVFVFVGAKLILNQNKESAWSEAKDNFWNIIKGFGIILVAYVVIKFALYALLSADQITVMQFMLG